MLLMELEPELCLRWV